MTQSNSVTPSSPRELSADEIAHVSGGDGGMLGSGTRQDAGGYLGSGNRDGGGGTIGSGT
jgi:hypothetical protein